MTTKIAQELMQSFCAAYEERNAPKLLSLFTEKACILGSAEDEIRVGKMEIQESFKRDWSQSEKVEIQIESFIPAPDEAEWATAICNTTIIVKGETHHFKNLRSTLVLSKEEGPWKIAHIHASFPDQRNPEGGSFPIAGSV